MDRLGPVQTGIDARRRSGGFTLIELMITVAIVAILAAIALPSYSIFMKRSRRGDTESSMMDIAQREQQYLLDTRTYAPNVAALNTTVPADVTAYYTIQICQTAVPCAAPGGAPPTFVVIATPIAGTAQAGDPTLTLDNTGVKGPAGVW
ncbi:MAG TPA: type IV pilin protein [Steroidobacteraceae bacterium]